MSQQVLVQCPTPMRTLSVCCFFVIALAAREALPCSGPPCSSVIESVPLHGSTIPANAPAVGVQRAVFGADTPDGGTVTLPPTLQPIGLRRLDGGIATLSPVVVRFGVFGATTEFMPGSEWELTFAEGSTACPGVTSRFVVGPAAAVPTTAATISWLDTTVVDGGESSCGAFPSMALARLRVTPTPEMEPWLALARWELEVDGRLAGAARYGVIPSGAYEPQRGASSLPINIVPIVCRPAPGSSAIGPGLHQLRVLARIEGFASAIASNVITQQIDCGSSTDAGFNAPDASFDAGADFDGGAQSRADAGDAGGAPDAGDAGSTVTSGDDGGRVVIVDGGNGIASGPVPPSGCTVSPGAGWMLLATLLVTASRSRRR